MIHLGNISLDQVVDQEGWAPYSFHRCSAVLLRQMPPGLATMRAQAAI